MKYNFDQPVERTGTQSVKYDLRGELFGNPDLIPMWVADMDFRAGDFILDALRERVDHGVFGYHLRNDDYFNSIRNWLKKKHYWEIENDWIIFSPGVVPALNLCTLALTDPGDSVIVQPPVYFPFFGAIEAHGRKISYNKLIYNDNKYIIDIDDLEKKASSGARMMIMSNPHNPVGRCWNSEELEQVAAICSRYDIPVISDEIHSDLLMPGNSHVPFASINKQIADLTITCIAPSKTFNLAGLSTSSLVISNEDLRKKISDWIENLHIRSGNVFGTIASIAAYTYGEEWLDQLLEYLKGNVDFVIGFLGEKVKKVIPVIPEATYLIWLDCRQLGMNGEQLGKFFSEAGVGMNEGSVFGPGGEGFMRMNLGCPRSTVEKAMKRIENAVNSY